mmetsp:Transcript_42253/g.98969  ORF Transcript_42253/g.98969 Transcript_42253/m.98969 type:complete len:219 (-) Transcript_42253:1136-1792(-)
MRFSPRSVTMHREHVCFRQVYIYILVRAVAIGVAIRASARNEGVRCATGKVRPRLDDRAHDCTEGLELFLNLVDSLQYQRKFHGGSLFAAVRRVQRLALCDAVLGNELHRASPQLCYLTPPSPLLRFGRWLCHPSQMSRGALRSRLERKLMKDPHGHLHDADKGEECEVVSPGGGDPVPADRVHVVARLVVRPQVGERRAEEHQPDTREEERGVRRVD